MKKLLIGLTLLASVSTFASADTSDANEKNTQKFQFSNRNLDQMNLSKAFLETTQDIKFPIGQTQISVGRTYLGFGSSLCIMYVRESNTDKVRTIKKGTRFEIESIRQEMHSHGTVEIPLYNAHYDGKVFERSKYMQARYNIFIQDSAYVEAISCLAENTRNEFEENGAPKFYQPYYVLTVNEMSKMFTKLKLINPNEKVKVTQAEELIIE